MSCDLIVYHTPFYVFRYIIKRHVKRISTQLYRWRYRMTWSGSERSLEDNNIQDRRTDQSTIVALCLWKDKRPRKSASRVIRRFSVYVARSLSNIGGTDDAVGAYAWRRLQNGRSSIFRGGRTVVAHTHNNTTESGSNSLTLLPRSVRRDIGVPNSKFSTTFVRRSVLKSILNFYLHFPFYKMFISISCIEFWK